jgi:hypothetical protein
MTHSVFLSIDYDDLRYKAVEVSGPGDFKRRFETDDPVKDFADAVTFAADHARGKRVPLMTTSSFEGFTWDCAAGKGYRFDETDMLVKAV